LILAAALSILWTSGFAAKDSIETSEPADLPIVYTEERPLVYEDVWDLWPYSFLNDTGEPVGYTIDLLRLIFQELDIPYRIKLKPLHDIMCDLKAGRADLMCGMDSHFYDVDAKYGNCVIQIFTHSVLHQKGEQMPVKTIDDLATQNVIVHKGGISHNLMVERGVDKNAMHYNDMQEAVQYAHNHPGAQIVGNTMSLKWLLHKFDYDDLELTPVNIPHGEYKFMSNDEHLLHQLDSVFTVLNYTGQLQPLQNKWFYPENKDTGIPAWVWYMVTALLVLIVLFLVYYISYRLYERKMTTSVRRSNDRLSLILNTSKVHIWLFDIPGKMLTSINSEGKKSVMPLSPNFGMFYVLPEDYERLCCLIDDMASQKKERETMEVNTVRKNSKEKHIFSVDYSIMKRDKNGRPTVIIGATNDITTQRNRQRQQKDIMLRYQHIFNSALVDNVSYDENGFIDGLNEKAIKGLGGNAQHIIDAKISVQSVLGDPGLSLDELDYTYLTQIYRSRDDKRPLNRILGRDELYYELQLVPVRDDGGRLLGIYGTGRDVTEIAKSYSRLQKNTVKLQEATKELQNYIRNIDYVMKNGGVRIVNYSPDTHTLTIYSEIEHVQHQLTQTRLLSLVAEESKNAALRIMNNMDNLTQQPVKAVIKSKLRVSSHVSERDGNNAATLGSVAHYKPLCLSFSFVPMKDANGNVTEYFGMCRDISDIKATEELLAQETKKAQEVETVKDAFLRNMCYEIRTPLNCVVGFAELIENDPDTDEEKIFIEEIKKNSRNLLNLVNNILFLSRLDAGMIEFKTVTVDFATFFEGRCRSAWEHCQQPGVEYIVEDFYKHLVLDIDVTNLGVVIDQIAINAAQHTTSGLIRARYDYNGEALTVAIQDTGCGIPADQSDRIFERFTTTHSGSSGLGLPICQEVVRRMGGRIHMKSDAGKGTIFWVIIPAIASEVERK
jgi:PAS domain S-box-containing protein